MTDTIRVKELKELFDEFNSHKIKIVHMPYQDWKDINKFIKESNLNDRVEIGFYRDRFELYIKGTIHLFPLGDDDDKITFGDMLADYFNIPCDTYNDDMGYSYHDIYSHVKKIDKTNYTTCDGSIVTKSENTNINTKKEKEDKMASSINFEFGPVNDAVRMSIYGLAIRNKNGNWVAYDKNKRQIVDVDIFNVNSKGMYYKMPVALADVAVGDIVMHQGIPCFVMSLKNDAMYAYEVMDINEGVVKTIVPATNMFNFNYMTKIVSLFDMGDGFMAPDESNPFGGMLPLMMMGENANATDMLMLMAMNGQMGDVNPWMMMALASSNNSSTFKNILPIMALTHMQKNRPIENSTSTVKSPSDATH